MDKAPYQEKLRVLIIGAGPAGLTAALEGVRRGYSVTVLEASDQSGGLAKTVFHDGYGFDIGGHRFFTKFPQVEQWWHEVLRDDFITVRRQSRIYYRGRFFDYPLRPLNALAGLGPGMSLRLAGSYLWARLHPRRPETTFEDWVSNRFGRLLFSIFFKSYTEKVWGIPCNELSADWAAQRIKSLSLSKAVLNAIRPQRGSITTLIEEFQYPRRGPGMLWERVVQLVEDAGGRVLLQSPVQHLVALPGHGFRVTAMVDGKTQELFADAVISTMPLPDLVAMLEPAPPADVRAAAERLTFRDFLSVLLVLKTTALFPDNWIYIHDPSIRASRVQNYGNWSAAMVPQPGTSGIGVEYHCQQGDQLWTKTDDQLIALATEELSRLRLAEPAQVQRGWVIREPYAYPRYTDDYQQHVKTIARHLASIPRLQTVGRAGMHRYNNQDHSMLTAMLAIDNLSGARHDLWAVNADDEYHEIKISKPRH
ncbi:MAG: NAD(P)/FAD-dependent oxidoreductase [bacterium]|nr:NAD(P)/FAD-dependent oxidoreductase [bacterium]